MLHRHARPAVAGAFLLGSILGASLSVVGLVLIGGLLSPLPFPLRVCAAAAAVATLLLREVTPWTPDLPQRAWQIPRTVFTARPERSAFRFAFELGTGVRTYITTSAPYALAAVLVLVPPTALTQHLLSGSAAAVGFGLGRSWVIALQPLRHTLAVEHPARWLRVSAIVSIAASGVALWHALGVS